MWGRAVACLLPLWALGAVAAGTRGRDATVALGSAPANVTVPLTNDHNIAYTARAKVGAGPAFPLIFDTGSSDLWVPSPDCSNCALPQSYEKTSKGTMYPDQSHDIHYGSGSVTVHRAVDSIAIGGLRSGADVTFGLATDEDPNIYDLFKQESASGIFGMAFPALATTLSNPPTAFQQWCIDHSIPKVAAFYMTDPEGSSEMLLGAFDLTKVAADGDGNRTIHYTPLLKRGSGDGQYAYWEVPVRLLSVTEGGPVSMAQLAAHDRRRGLLDEHAVPQGAVLAGERPASDSAAVHWVERWAASLWPLMPWAAVPAPSLRRMRRPRSAPRRRYPLPPGMERVVQPSRGPPLSSVVPGAGEAWRSGLTLSGAVASGLGADGVARPVHLSGDNTVYSDCGGSDLSCTAIVDTGTSYIGVPGGKWESFMGAVAGGRCAESKGTFMCQTCDLTKFPYINVGTSHQLFVLKPADYVAVDSDSDTCFLQFQRVGGSSMFILGATFIRRYYSIFDMESEPARVGAGSSNYSPPSRPNPNAFWMTFFVVIALTCCGLGFCGLVYFLVARSTERGMPGIRGSRRQYPLSGHAVQPGGSGLYVHYGAQQAVHGTAPGTYAVQQGAPPGTYAVQQGAPPGTYAVQQGAPPGTYAMPPAAPAPVYAPFQHGPSQGTAATAVPVQPGTYAVATGPPSASPYTQYPASRTYAVPPRGQ